MSTTKIKISESELYTLLENDTTAEEALEIYFDIVSTNTFKLDYQLKKNIVLVNEDGTSKGLGGTIGRFIKTTIRNTANSISRRKRNKKYKKIIKAYPNRVRIVSEGDSWFQHPLPKVKDIIDHLIPHYAIYSLGAGGDVLRNMFQNPEYVDAIEREEPHIFLISAGGNDILDKKQFKRFLNEFSEVEEAPAGRRPKRFLKDAFFDELDKLESIYQAICQKLQISHPALQIFTHCYDYIIPNNPDAERSESWLGDGMNEKDITRTVDQKVIIRYMIDRFAAKMKALDKKFSNVHFIDTRKIVRKDQWFDEIHPDTKGFQDIAIEFQKAIDAVLNA